MSYAKNLIKYLKIINNGVSDDRLISAKAAIAQRVEIHSMEMDNGVMRMRAVDGGLAIAAGDSVTLAPGGLHIMLMGLTTDLAPDTKHEIILVFEKAGEVKNKICIIVDDICDTAGTLVKASDLLINKGAREVHAYISHGVLSDPAIERIEKSSLSSLVVTDSISIISKIKNSTKIRIVPTAPLFAQALLNIANGNSVSSLFDSERLRPIYKPYYPKSHIEKKRKA